MDYARPSLADRLAAEYVLGTLRGPARRRFETLLLAHPRMRAAVADWQRRLAVLEEPIAEQVPAPRVWQSIESRLFSPATSLPWWQRLGLWQGLTGALGAAILALALLLATPPSAQAPPLLVVMSGEAGPASFVASVSADGASLVLKPVNGVPLQAQRVLELWSVPVKGAPRSLGIVAADRATTVLRAQLLKNTDALAVSIEPPGGSPTGAPTGPIVSVGKLRT